MGETNRIIHPVNSGEKKYHRPELTDKESRQENGANLVGSQGKSFNALQAKADPQDIVERPMFLVKVSSHNHTCHDTRQEFRSRKVRPEFQILGQNPFRQGMRNLCFVPQLVGRHGFGTKFIHKGCKGQRQGSNSHGGKVPSNDQIHQVFS